MSRLEGKRFTRSEEAARRPSRRTHARYAASISILSKALRSAQRARLKVPTVSLQPNVARVPSVRSVPLAVQPQPVESLTISCRRPKLAPYPAVFMRLENPISVGGESHRERCRHCREPKRRRVRLLQATRAPCPAPRALSDTLQSASSLVGARRWMPPTACRNEHG